MEGVLRKALRLLELMLAGFVDAQRLVFDRLDELLAVQVALDQMALALKQVFCANESLCLRVTAKSIARIVSICGGAHRSPTGTCRHWTRLRHSAARAHVCTCAPRAQTTPARCPSCSTCCARW